MPIILTQAKNILPPFFLNNNKFDNVNILQ